MLTTNLLSQNKYMNYINIKTKAQKYFDFTKQNYG